MRLQIARFRTGNDIQVWPRLRVLSCFANLRKLDLGTCLDWSFIMTDSAFEEMGPLPNLEDLVSNHANQ